MGDCICVCRGDGPEGCGICNETGTTPDLAGLCERPAFDWLIGQHIGWLRVRADCLMERGEPGDDVNADHLRNVANTLERQAAEIERLREGLSDALPYVVQFEDMRDGIHGAPEPNDAMRLVHEIRAALTGEDS